MGVTLYILSIGDLSEKFMDFTFDMYFRQFWTDPRYPTEMYNILVEIYKYFQIGFSEARTIGKIGEVYTMSY